MSADLVGAAFSNLHRILHPLAGHGVAEIPLVRVFQFAGGSHIAFGKLDDADTAVAGGAQSFVEVRMRGIKRDAVRVAGGDIIILGLNDARNGPWLAGVRFAGVYVCRSEER